MILGGKLLMMHILMPSRVRSLDAALLHDQGDGWTVHDVQCSPFLGFSGLRTHNPRFRAPSLCSLRPVAFDHGLSTLDLARCQRQGTGIRVLCTSHGPGPLLGGPGKKGECGLKRDRTHNRFDPQASLRHAVWRCPVRHRASPPHYAAFKIALT